MTGLTKKGLPRSHRPRPHEHIGHNAVHMLYAITCEEFDQLVLRSEGRCERCTREMRKPVIDHDHMIGRHAVRGLLCHRCNITLAVIERGLRRSDSMTERYLADPFYLQLPAIMPGYRPPLPSINDAAARARLEHAVAVEKFRKTKEEKS